MISDVWLVGHDGKAAVWVCVDGVWRVAIKEQQVADASVSYCANLAGARAGELPEVRLSNSLLDIPVRDGRPTDEEMKKARREMRGTNPSAWASLNERECREIDAWWRIYYSATHETKKRMLAERKRMLADRD